MHLMIQAVIVCGLIMTAAGGADDSSATKPNVRTIWQHTLPNGEAIRVDRDGVRVNGELHLRHTFYLESGPADSRTSRKLWSRDRSLRFIGIDDFEMLAADMAGLDLVVVFNESSRCHAFVVHPISNGSIVVAPRLQERGGIPADQLKDPTVTARAAEASIGYDLGRIVIEVKDATGMAISYALTEVDGDVLWKGRNGDGV